MAKANNMAARQINPYGAYKGREVLHIEENNSTHYSAKTDKQIRVPIANVDEFLHKLKGNA